MPKKAKQTKYVKNKKPPTKKQKPLDGKPSYHQKSQFNVEKAILPPKIKPHEIFEGAAPPSNKSKNKYKK
tara:strand:+ start:4980 stop:5189 length:210 start_codon:yes stop_codon:yes gene_type:complete